MIDDALISSCLNIDETTFQVLHEPDRAPTTKSYKWFFSGTSEGAEASTLLYSLIETAKTHNLVLDLTPVFAIITGEWNLFFAVLRTAKDVISIPTVDMLAKVVVIGTCSGVDTDKFAKFNLTPLKGRKVGAPLMKEGLANIECKVVDIVQIHTIVVLEAIAANIDVSCNEKRTVHAVGDGIFVVDGRKLSRKKMMVSKLPDGI